MEFFKGLQIFQVFLPFWQLEGENACSSVSLAKSKCWPDLFRLHLKGHGEVVLLCLVPEMWTKGHSQEPEREIVLFGSGTLDWLDQSHQLHSESPLEVPTYP